MSTVERAVDAWRTQLPEGEAQVVRPWTHAQTAKALLGHLASAPAVDRPHIITVLGLIGHKPAAPAVLRALSAPELRPTAAQALARMGGRWAHKGLLKRLVQCDCEDAATALGQLHELEALDHLLTGVATEDAPIKRRRVYLTAAAQVVEPGNRQTSAHKRVVDAILSAMDSELLMEAACEAAAELGGQRLVARLRVLDNEAGRRALGVIQGRT